jgi:hypothetical protein
MTTMPPPLKDFNHDNHFGKETEFRNLAQTMPLE